MLKSLSLKKGFTLVELLIVMGIIAILVVLSVSGYTSFRKMALIDLSADALVAQINEMKDKSIHGTDILKEAAAPVEGVTSDEDEEFLKCYGLRLKKENPDSGYVMTAAVYKFTDAKVWDVPARKWVYQGCGDASEDVLDDAIFEMDSMVNVEKITEMTGEVLADFSGDEFTFRFVPPTGSLEVLKDGEFQSGENSIQIKIRYGMGEDDRYSRNVLIDLATGKTVKN
ncbi:MAG: prepilin-type N-terminal cleavage/methylation domain-containing protein [Candidatus Gracilibacteria bacterium]